MALPVVPNYGTLSSLDTLASQRLYIAQYGEDRAWEAVDAALTAHNRIVRELMTDLVDTTNQRLRRYGSAGGAQMDELDEFGTPNPQKTPAGVTVGFPMRKYGAALQWTRIYFQTARTDELAAQMTNLMDADAKNIQRQIKRAVFTPTNNLTYEDRLVDHVQLPVRALINADGTGMPVGPNGELFDGATHTHYLFTAGTALAAADLSAAVTTVTEHVATGEVLVYINSAQEAAVRALAGFIGITPTMVTPAYTSQAIVMEYDRMQINNRRIGYFGPNYAEVWVKPWIPAGYIFAWVKGEQKPLAMRTRDASATSGDVKLMAEDEEHPLRARSYEREFGVGVWNRINGASLYIDTGSAGAYVAPTI